MSQSLTDKQQFWFDHLQRAQESGATVAEYAGAKNIEPQKLYQWRSILEADYDTWHRNTFRPYRASHRDITSLR